jgi:hypothetical protein
VREIAAALLFGGLLSASLPLPFLEDVLGNAVANSLKLCNAVLDLEFVNCVVSGEVEYAAVEGG